MLPFVMYVIEISFNEFLNQINDRLQKLFYNHFFLNMAYISIPVFLRTFMAPTPGDRGMNNNCNCIQERNIQPS